INSFTDLLDKNVLNGMVRFANGMMTVLAIALGLFVAMLIFQLK
ncbi:threonine/serine exporter, partial [Halomonas marinisediminis]